MTPEAIAIALRAIAGELGAAESQMLPSDDRIIAIHIGRARGIAEIALLQVEAGTRSTAASR